jgi:hypothetical protein
VENFIDSPLGLYFLISENLFCSNLEHILNSMIDEMRRAGQKSGLDELESFHFLEEFATHLRGASSDNDAGLLESVDLVLGAALSAGDDGTSVAHATAGWSRQTSDE